MQLSHCDHRIPLPGHDDQFFCRSLRVKARNSIVSAKNCRMCVEREVAYQIQRPVPVPLPDPAEMLHYPAKRYRWYAPGNLTRSFIHHATAGKIAHGRQCEQWSQAMNEWGWRGCWQHRRLIVERLTNQARNEGYASRWWQWPLYPARALGHWAWTRMRSPELLAALATFRRSLWR